VSNKAARSKATFCGATRPDGLQTLHSLGPLHGYAIAARLEQVSGGALQLNMGTLYPALMQLEQRGPLRGNWGTTETNLKARFYAVTPAAPASAHRRTTRVGPDGGDHRTLLHGEA
jgi:DNA-binding PadR family transcriptional regulator